MPKICALLKDAISGMAVFGDDYILPNLNLKIEIRDCRRHGEYGIILMKNATTTSRGCAVVVKLKCLDEKPRELERKLEGCANEL